MKAKTNYFLLGLFVIVGTAAVIGGVLMIGATTFARRGLVVETYFDESVQGLEEGAIVRFRGVRIGVVTEIELASKLYPTMHGYAAVRALLDPTETGLSIEQFRERIQQRIDQGYRVRLSGQGLTGTLYLETDMVTDPQLLQRSLEIDWDPSHPYIPSVPSRIARIGTSVEEVLSSLEKTDFPGLVEDARDTLQAVRETAKSIGSGVIEEEVSSLRRSAEATLEVAQRRIDSVAARAESLLAKGEAIADALEADTIRGIVEDIAAVAEALPATQARVDRLLESGTAASDEFTAELRLKGREIDLILAELRRAVSRFAALAETLERYPSLLLIGNPPRRTEPGK